MNGTLYIKKAAALADTPRFIMAFMFSNTSTIKNKSTKASEARTKSLTKIQEYVAFEYLH